MNDLIKPPNPTDGWEETAAEAEKRIIRGSILKFNDWKWSIGKEKEWIEIKASRCLVAHATAVGWAKWQGAPGKPVEYRMRERGVPMPERTDLGDNDPTEWELGPDGQSRDPWQLTHFVYLVDPQTFEEFTFSTSSWGGRDCVINLAGQIKRMRDKHPHAVPLVELGAAPMSTKFGRKSKPVLKVVGWLNTDPDPPTVIMPPQQPPPLPPPTVAEELDDAISF
jgi:hypothetical protein